MSMASFNLPFGVSDALPWSMKASCVIDAISTLTSSPEVFISATTVHNVYGELQLVAAIAWIVAQTGNSKGG